MRLEDLAGEFPEQIRRRGAGCHRAGVVSIVAHSATRIRAVALGTHDYSVRIEAQGRTLVLGCSCPYFEDQGPCKHLWATALLANHRKFLGAMPGWSKLTLTAEEATWEDGDGDDDGEDDDLDRDDDAGEDAAEDPPGPATSDRDPQLTLLRQAASAPSSVRLPYVARSRAPVPQPPPPETVWQTLLGEANRPSPFPPAPTPPPPANLLYVIEVEKTRQAGELVVALRTRAPKKNGGWTKDKQVSIPVRALDAMSDERDRQALPLYQAASSLGGSRPVGYYGYGYAEKQFPTEAQVPAALAGALMSLLSDTGRLFVREARDAELLPARYDGDPPWDFVLRLRRRQDGAGSELSGNLRRGDESAELSSPLVLTASGWVVFRDVVGRLRHFGAFSLLGSFRRQPPVPVAPSEEGALVKSLFALAALPRLELPDDLALREVSGSPKPVLKIGPPERRPWGQPSDRPTADLSFSYGDASVAPADPRDVLAQVEAGRLLRRDRATETASARKLAEVGFQRAAISRTHQPDPGRFDIAPGKLPGAVRLLVGTGWRVEAEGKLYRQAGRFALSVTSGVDWFDLHARIDFDGVTATLPELLRALRRGEKMIVLGDGTFGVLPEEWLKRYGLLAEVGVAEGERLRFRPAQVGLLDALLAAEPEVSIDRLFSKARDELRLFERVESEHAPRGFRGELRPYQELGLGWLSFLRRFGFGGCLADDMGLGKTVQVLAMLASRPRVAGKPSLVVVPKSLVWNWQQEAARFVPKLRLLAHIGSARAGDARALRRAVERADVVLTTYGLLRKDVAFLREIEMDYLILDEAQAIKNADSESAKAARLLRGDHRLALSGTPIENHIGELWSLVDFLNPGMLGSARAFAGAGGAKRPDPEALALLARVLRPFILRRTKEQVAPELPPKHEETILCEMEPEQRRLYDELRTHYRASLLGKIAREGLGKAKIQVLEALLRLRQAACHPGLIDKKRAKDGSGKMDVLFARLDEVRQEGHKTLVFSQFTSFLDLVRARLDAARVPYEYLDGKTRDREACVKRFQSDAACPLFLISLKAGGLGLNLTAADYVFILDPWWNPAVEAQAVDRAHRIGQDKHVFVYRLLCRDSVEEKVAALQEEKRDLAASIINADGSLIQKLDRQTLELLLA
jgi:hypothetical protein